jgi:ankyrin repeat protein
LKKGAKVRPTVFRRHVKTALAHAAENGHVEVVRLILGSDRGSDSWARYYLVIGALYWTARSGQIAAAKLLLEELALLLPSTSFPLQVSQGLDSQDAVVGAVENGHETMVRLLLENKAKAPPTALKEATEKRHLVILGMLLDWGLHDGGYGGEEKIALLWAASNGDIEMVRLLLSRGTDRYRDATDKEGRTALHCAAAGGSLTTWTRRVRFPYNERDPRWEHYRHGHKQVIEYLLLHGDVNIDATDKYGITALHYAACGKKEIHCLTDILCGAFEPVIKPFLDHGADRRAKDSYGRLALHCAAASWNTEIFSLLFQQKSDLDERDKKGRTPLHYAVNRYYIADWNGTKKSSPMIKLLLDEGASIDAQDILGNTALHDAARFGKEDIFEQLQDRGAGWFIKNNFGLTAPEILAQWKRMPKESQRMVCYGGYVRGHGEGGNRGIGVRLRVCD